MHNAFFSASLFENGGQSCYFVLLLRFVYSSLPFTHVMSRGDNHLLIFAGSIADNVLQSSHTFS